MTRILRGEELQNKLYEAVEAATKAQMQAWHDALARIEDPHKRGDLENACIGLAGAWLDAALLLGFQMAQDPGAWLFQSAGTEE